MSAYKSDGTLKPAWLGRLDRVLRATDQQGVVVILGLFYFGQDQRLENEGAVVRAVDGVTDWLLAGGYTNVLIEINNEANLGYDHPILKQSRVDELIARVGSRSGGRLKVSTSLSGGQIPDNELIAASDFVLLHGNGRTASEIREMVEKVRNRSAWEVSPKPIVFNEDSTKLANMDAAVGEGASWGYHDRGANDYVNGFQSPPVNWTINTSTKKAFFDRVAELTKEAGGSTATARFAPATLSFAAEEGTTPPSQTTVLDTSDRRSSAFTVRSDRSWLTATPTSGTTPSTITVTANTSGLAPGSYSGTLTATVSDHGTATATVTLTVSHSAGFRLLVSKYPDRRSPIPLQGATLSGDVYVFTSPDDPSIVEVRFWIDDPNRSAEPYRIETSAPYDLAGGSVSTAKPFDVAQLGTGAHLVSAEVDLGASGTEVVEASFDVTG